MIRIQNDDQVIVFIPETENKLYERWTLCCETENVDSKLYSAVEKQV